MLLSTESVAPVADAPEVTLLLVVTCVDAVSVAISPAWVSVPELLEIAAMETSLAADEALLVPWLA